MIEDLVDLKHKISPNKINKTNHSKFFSVVSCKYKNSSNKKENITDSTGYKTLLSRGSTNKKENHNQSNKFVRPFNEPINFLNENERKQLEFTQTIRNINLENIFKPKKKVLSSEEIEIERIEKEMQEIEKLKKRNKENLEKLFQPTSFLLKKREAHIDSFHCPQKKETNLPNNELYLEEDFISITDNISRLSFISSPQKTNQINTFTLFKTKEEKEKEKFRKREEKNLMIKRQTVINKVEKMSLFEKNVIN